MEMQPCAIVALLAQLLMERPCLLSLEDEDTNRSIFPSP